MMLRISIASYGLKAHKGASLGNNGRGSSTSALSQQGAAVLGGLWWPNPASGCLCKALTSSIADPQSFSADFQQ